MPGASAPPELRLPRPAPAPVGAWLASLAVHAAALAVLLVLFVPPGQRPRGLPLAALLPPPSPRIIGYLVLSPPPPSLTSPDGVRSAPAIAAAKRPPSVPADSIPVHSPRTDAIPTSGVTTPTQPALGTGLLWDRRAGAPTYVNRSHAEMTDSAVEAMVQQYWDSLARLPGGGQLLLPTWTATIAGQEFGLDQQWVTVAGVKVPAVLLGLIPIGVAGNQSEALDKVGQGREEDYQRSRAGQEAAADQREQIKAMRERSEAEHELRKKQREAP